MRNYIPFVFLLLWWLAPASSKAQQPVITHTYAHYGVREGLVQSQVQRLFQDSFGYMWFGTKGGVSRFDGKNFRNFPDGAEVKGGGLCFINQYEDQVLVMYQRMMRFFNPDGTVEEIEVPDDCLLDTQSFIDGHRLYVFNGSRDSTDHAKRFYLIYDFKNKTFHRSAVALPYIAAVYRSQEGIYVLSENLNAIYKIEETRCSTIYTTPTDGVRRLVCNANTHEALLQESLPGASAKTKLYRVHIRNDRFEKEFIADLEIDFRVDRARKLNDGRYLLSEGTNYKAFLLDGKALTPFSVKTLFIVASLIDRDGNLWLATDEGAFNCHRLTFEAFTLGLARNDFIWDLQKDEAGNLWTGLYANGIWRTDKHGKAVKAKVYEHGVEIDCKGMHMNGCRDAQGRLYFNTTKGLLVHPPRQADNLRWELIKVGCTLASYYDKQTHTVFTGGEEDASRLLCAISEDLTVKKYPFGRPFVISICRDGNKRLRIGSFYGEAYLDEEKGEIVADTVTRKYRSLISMDVDRRGTLWKATLQGLFAEDKAGRDRKLLDGRMLQVTNYQDRYLIAGDEPGVLYLLDLNKYYQTGEAHFLSFDRYLGFDALECGQNGRYIDTDGFMWVMGGDKVLRFNPEEVMKISSAPILTPYISAIYTINSDGDRRRTDRSKGIKASAEYNTIRIEWLQASIENPDSLRFRYRLRGYSDQWTISADRQVEYSNLDGGKYCFELQATTDGMQWSPVVTSSQLMVKSPFWFSIGGISLGIVMLIALFAFLLLLLRRHWENQREREKTMDSLRLHSARSKHIPHFTGNVMGAINYMVLSEPENVNEYIQIFTSFSQQTLLYSDTPSRRLGDEIKYTELYLKLEQLRFGEKLQYEVQVADGLNRDVQVPTMTLFTFCENAIKHGLRHKKGVGCLQIRVEDHGTQLLLSVEDNGIGREEACKKQTEGSRKGLAIIEQQLSVYNKKNKKKSYIEVEDLTDEQGNATGTRFTLFLPPNYNFDI